MNADVTDQLLRKWHQTSATNPTTSTRAASLATTANCLEKYLQGESSPHPFLYAHRVEDHPLHFLPSMLYLLAR